MNINVMTSFIRKITILALALVSIIGLTSSSLVSAQAARNEVCQGVGVATGGSGCGGSENAVGDIISGALNIFSAVVGITGVIMVLVAGFKFINSGGDSGKVASARGTITWGLIGLAVAAIAQALVQFVLSNVS